MTIVKKIVLYICAIVIFGLSSCRIEDGKQTLSVSVEPQRYLLEQIVGDKWNVNAVLGKGNDPESFDPSLTTIRDLMNSKVYFLSGNIPFEEKLRRRIDAEDGDIKIVDTSDGMELINGTHHHDHDDDSGTDEHGDDFDSFDPHVWSSVKNAIIMSDNMLKVLLEIDPQNADYYRSNHAKLIAELKSMDAKFSEILADKKNQSFLVWHPSLSYFSRDYGLNQIALDVENKELSANEFKSKIDEARGLKVDLFIVQPEYDKRRSAEVAGQIGARVVDVNLLDYSWPEEMNKVVMAIAGK